MLRVQPVIRDQMVWKRRDLIRRWMWDIYNASGELEGGKKRVTDSNWSLKVNMIDRSIVKKGELVMYYLKDGPEEDSSGRSWRLSRRILNYLMIIYFFTSRIICLTLGVVFISLTLGIWFIKCRCLAQNVSISYFLLPIQTTPVLKASLPTFEVPFSSLQMVPCMHDPASI